MTPYRVACEPSAPPRASWWTRWVRGFAQRAACRRDDHVWRAIGHVSPWPRINAACKHCGLETHHCSYADGEDRRDGRGCCPWDDLRIARDAGWNVYIARLREYEGAP